MDKQYACQTWVGNIFQRFESVCQEVDDFVNKDTVKFVENHVQTVGKSMKKFYSGVVQDILPPLVDPVKHVAEVVPSRQIDLLGSYTSSIVSIKENASDVEASKSSVKEDPFDPTGCGLPPVNGLCHQKQSSCPASGIPVEEAETNLCFLHEDGEQINTTSGKAVQAHKNSDTSVQENVAEEECLYEDISTSKYRNSPKMCIYDKCTDEKYNDDSEVTSHESSKNHLACGSLEEDASLHQSLECNASLFENADWGIEDIVDLNLNIDNMPVETVDELECDSNTSSTLQSFEPECSIVHCENKDNEVSHISSSNIHLESSVVYCENKEAESSIVYHENKVEELPHISSSNFQPAKVCDDDLSRSLPANSLVKPETIYFNPADSVGCFSETSNCVSSPESFSAIGNDESDATMGVAFSSCVSSPDTEDTTRTAEAVSGNGLSTIMHHQYCKLAQPEAYMSYAVTAEDGFTVGVEDQNMETIDLSDKKQLDESCVLVDDKELYAFPCRSGSRSYKKIIQDAFASRKRLPKEYKQLAIWYGDIDSEFSQLSVENKLSNIGSTSMELKKAEDQDLCDSEWELL